MGANAMFQRFIGPAAGGSSAAGLALLALLLVGCAADPKQPSFPYAIQFNAVTDERTNVRPTVWPWDAGRMVQGLREAIPTSLYQQQPLTLTLALQEYSTQVSEGQYIYTLRTLVTGRLPRSKVQVVQIPLHCMVTEGQQFNPVERIEAVQQADRRLAPWTDNATLWQKLERQCAASMARQLHNALLSGTGKE